jgi:Ser/Thr protein kinase RdoA (MazF antagonist)
MKGLPWLATKSYSPFLNMRQTVGSSKPAQFTEEVADQTSHRRGDSAASEADAVAGRSPRSPIHGDAPPDNVVRDDTRLLLTDFEKGSLGRAIYDLAPLHMLARRSGYETARVDEILRAYGSRTDGEAEASFTRLFEVVVIAGATALYAAHAVFEDELRLRLSSLERPKREVRWTPHKQLLAEVRKSASAG